MPANLKEALCIIKGGKYVYATPSDRLIIQRFVDPDVFLEKLKCLYDDGDWVRSRKFMRCIRILQILIASIALAYTLLFLASMVTTLSPGDL